MVSFIILAGLIGEGLLFGEAKEIKPANKKSSKSKNGKKE